MLSPYNILYIGAALFMWMIQMALIIICEKDSKKRKDHRKRVQRNRRGRMNVFKLIDMLCEVTSIMADIVRKQQAVIEQHGIQIDDPELDRQLTSMDAEMKKLLMWLMGDTLERIVKVLTYDN